MWQASEGEGNGNDERAKRGEDRGYFFIVPVFIKVSFVNCIRRAVFHALSSIDENEDESYREQQERQFKILAIYSCGVSSNTNRSHMENYRNEEVSVGQRRQLWVGSKFYR